MDNLIVEATKSSPWICFDAENRILEIKGKSYPENASEFFAPVFEWLKKYFASTQTAPTEVNLDIIYLNSSSSKAFLVLFDILEQAARNGHTVHVNWRYDEDDETALELGEEFMEDLEFVSFNLVKIQDR
ncbi:MAG: DUF1987 domain-containing protein [Desulfomonilaceae bacterium]|nr:DUF1987 domain-containing protein [Desulfomonilaceae bacterium]